MVTRNASRFAVVIAFISGFSLSAPALSQNAPAPAQGKVVGLAFVGRTVGDLDRSVAYYEAIGFKQDPAANSDWRRDEVVEGLYGASGFTTRMAKMYVDNKASGARFVVYLRQLKGLKQKNMSNHTAWEPGATHFGIAVPDARALWGQLQASGHLRARSWGGKLIFPPGQTQGALAYATDPDGLDVEIFDQRPALPPIDGRPRPALLPGVSHVGVVTLDIAKARGFYEGLLGGQATSKESPWVQGDFYDSATGGHGNILRFCFLSFPEAAAPASRLNFELVEYQNRKKPIEPHNITDIGVAYVGFEVQGLDAFLARAIAAGAKPVSTSGIMTMRSGTREIMVRDPDVGGFVLLYEHPKK